MNSMRCILLVLILLTVLCSANSQKYEDSIQFKSPDHLGSSSYITDASGEVYQHFEYFPFGETFYESRHDHHRTPMPPARCINILSTFHLEKPSLKTGTIIKELLTSSTARNWTRRPDYIFMEPVIMTLGLACFMGSIRWQRNI